MAVGFHFRTCATAFAALVMAVACSGDDSAPYSPPPSVTQPPPPPPPPDKTPPVLVQRVPEPGDDNVWLGAPIRLRFSEPLAAASVGGAVVAIQSEVGPVATRASLSADGLEIRLVIESPHWGPAHLTISVANTITDVAGNAFAGASWSFTAPLWQAPGGMPAASGIGPLRAALALDPDDNPVIAWHDATSGMAAIRVARLVDSHWQRLGEALNVRADAIASAAHVAVTPNDEPIVVWQEVADAKHVYAKQFRNGRWELMGPGPVDAPIAGEAGEPVVALDQNGRPVVAWIENHGRVELRRWESNAWLPVGSAWDAGAPLADLALALDGPSPVVATTVTGATSTDVRVARWSAQSQSWEPIGAPLDRAIEHAAAHPAIAVSPAGHIGVAWQENDGFSDSVYAAEFDDREQAFRLWGKALDIDFEAPALSPSIAYTREGAPMVAWNEEHAEGARTYVARWVGENWEVPGAGLNDPGARSSMSAALVLDSASNPVVTWEERASGDGGAAAQVLARRYNGGADQPYGLGDRRAAPCSFPLEGAPDFPVTLSETHCFADVPGRVPAPGLVPYDVNSPLWSDGALKRRFIILPEGTTVGFSEKNSWQFPVGTIFVKEFLYQREPGNAATIFPMETRFLLKRCEPGLCRAAWEGYSYQWNDSATEATLLDNDTQTIFKDWPSAGGTHRHGYPGRDECRQCHVGAAGGVLGMQTGQLNRNFDYGGAVDNQLRAWTHAGMFSSGADGGADGGPSVQRLDALPRLPTPGDAAYSNTERVRSYFHSNCSHCHRPDGRWPVIDFLYDSPLVGAKEPNANICNELVPGDAEKSRIYIKDSAREGNLPPDFFGLPMPPVATWLPDQHQLPTLKAWINEMTSCP